MRRAKMLLAAIRLRAGNFCRLVLGDRRPSKADAIGFAMAMGLLLPAALFGVLCVQKWVYALVELMGGVLR